MTSDGSNILSFGSGVSCNDSTALVAFAKAFEMLGMEFLQKDPCENHGPTGTELG
jgi:hypothetical protein